MFERLQGDGIKIAFASSAKGDELQTYKAKADSAERSKPHGEIFQATLDRLPGIALADVVVIGDTPYDADAASRVGLRTIGARSGGSSDTDLRKAGCVAIYDDPADLLACYEAFFRNAQFVTP